MTHTGWSRLDLDRLFDGVEAVVVDVEGNGRHPADIVEIALLPLQPGGGTAVDALRSWLVRPPYPITRRAASLHGIRNTDVADAAPWSAIVDIVTETLAGRLVVAHNASVERQVLTTHLPGWQPAGWLDTLRLARAVWPDLAGGHGLDNLITHADLAAQLPRPTDRPGMTRHRAGYDAWMTAALLASLVGAAGPDPDRLVTGARLPVTQLPGVRPPDARPDEEGLW